MPSTSVEGTTMTNPFNAEFDSNCQSCDELIEIGEAVYADEGEFICTACAVESGIVCECGEYKKPEYNTCWDCRGKPIKPNF